MSATWPQTITIVTTFDPHPGVMASFLGAAREVFAGGDSEVEVIVVNGFGGGRAELPDAGPAITVRTLDAASGAGQSKALLQGIACSRGQVVISMDPDMYRCLAHIPLLLAEHARGSRVVYTRRLSRSGAGWPRKLGSEVFSLAVSAIMRVRIHDINSPMFLVDREVVEALVPLQLPAEAYKFVMPQRYRHRFAQVALESDAGLPGKPSHYRWGLLMRLFFQRLRLVLRHGRSAGGQGAP